MPPKSKKKASPTDSVSVAIRVRPHTFTDGGDNRDCLNIDPEFGEIRAKDPDGKKTEKSYAFDTVFPTTAEQVDVFQKIGAPMVDSVMDGYNTTLFTYGQTGSGKTYTIQGLPGAGVRMNQDYDVEKHKGLTPRIAEYLFEKIEEMVDDDPAVNSTLEMSYLEIYNEQIRDLLQPGPSKSLEVREDSNHKPYVEGLLWRKCITSEQIMKHLLMGNTRRQVASTKMNEVSSRSHSIVMLKIGIKYDPPQATKPDTESLLYIVDLAGSERQDKTGAEGETLTEAKNINKSLLMLGRAIHAFGEKGAKAHVPLRDSKLTRLLKESFGGNSRTWMIATCSASPYNMVETKSTLDYAANAKLITNNAEQNRMARQLELGEMRQLNKKLEDEIAAMRDKMATMEANQEEAARKMAEEMVKGANGALADDLKNLREEIKTLQAEKERALETETELRNTIAKGVASDVADELRKELDTANATIAALRKEIKEKEAMTVTAAAASAPGRGRDATSGSHLGVRSGSPTGMGARKPSMQKQMNDLLDDPRASAEERVKRMEGRALVESAGSFLRKKSFNQMYKQATGAQPRGSWIGQSGNRYASMQSGSTLEDLMAAKARAIENEDFTEAQRLNEEIKAAAAVPKMSLNDLMASRQRAIASENFAEAQAIQAQINALKMSQQREQGGQFGGHSGAATPRDAQMMSFDGAPRGGPGGASKDDDYASQGGSKAMFVGRVSISLRFLVQGNTPSKYHTLPLECDSSIQLDPMCPPQLLVNIYQLDKKGGKDDGRMDFVVHVIQAKGIPKQFSNSVHCKYVFKWGEKDYYKSNEVKMSTDPEFDYKKRYAFPKLTEQLYSWFTSENVMTFEVIGIGTGAPGSARGGYSEPPAINVSSSDPRDSAPPKSSRSGPYY